MYKYKEDFKIGKRYQYQYHNCKPVTCVGIKINGAPLLENHIGTIFTPGIPAHYRELEEPVKKWVNIYSDGLCGEILFNSKEEALRRLRRAPSGVIACIQIEFTEGEGLDV